MSFRENESSEKAHTLSLAVVTSTVWYSKCSVGELAHRKLGCGGWEDSNGTWCSKVPHGVISHHPSIVSHTESSSTAVHGGLFLLYCHLCRGVGEVAKTHNKYHDHTGIHSSGKCSNYRYLTVTSVNRTLPDHIQWGKWQTWSLKSCITVCLSQ